MEVFKVIYDECQTLGSTFGFGAFEGGVIYFSVFSLIIFKGFDSVKAVLKKEKKVIKKDDSLNVNIKVIK